MNVFPNVYISPIRKSASLLPKGTVKCTHIWQHRKYEINKTGAITEVRILVE